jgi:microcystin-dependent protein
MSDPFMGEIRVFGFSFAPRGWAQCNGQLMPIAQNTALFALLGTNYGGNGTTTFQLPNLMGSAAMAAGAGPGLTPRTIGEVDGSQTVTLINSQIPAHTHSFYAATANDPSEILTVPTNTAYLGVGDPDLSYADTTNNVVQFVPQALGLAGGSQPHENRQPLLVLNFCIATAGIFPSRN